jgi:hypothetical protein
VRQGLYDYTIAVDGRPWERSFSSVWQPIFHPASGAVIAPVRLDGQWTLAADGAPIWPQRFVQAWHQQVSPDGRRLAAIVSPRYGYWTLALDGESWRTTVNEMIMDLRFSPDSRRVAATAKHDGRWTLMVDDGLWRQGFDQVRAPVFSPDGRLVAMVGETEGRFALVVNDHRMPQSYQALWQPVFSPDGTRMLVRGIEKGTYRRQVLAVDQLLA